MDIVEVCKSKIKEQLDYIDSLLAKQDELGCCRDGSIQTQIDSVVVEKDKDLDRILDQQAHIKMLIEKDNHIKTLKNAIAEDTRAIESLRKSCAKIGLEALKDRQELLEAQAKEVEKFQMNQLRSIAEDYRRHQEILEQRKREILALKKETENEERNRESYLSNCERELEKQIQNRQQK